MQLAVRVTGAQGAGMTSDSTKRCVFSYKTAVFFSLLSHEALAEIFKRKSGQPHIF